MRFSLITSIDVADEHRSIFERWLHESFLAGSLPGLSPDPVCFRALRVETAYRVYQPTPSYTVFFEFDDDPARVTASDAFVDWWAGQVAARFGWITGQNWVVAELVTGPPSPLDHSRILLTQVHLGAAHEDGWAGWYDAVHIPQSQRVPNLFGPENRRFRAREISAPRWHTAAVPRFTHLVPIEDGADVVAAAATPEFLELIADTQAQWAGAIESARSTICERFR